MAIAPLAAGNDEVQHGVHFLFVCASDPMQRVTRPLWGEKHTVAGAIIEGPRLTPLALAVVATDKDVYREADDVASIVVVDPVRPDEEVEVQLTLAGRRFRSWNVRLDWNGMAVVSVADLVAGAYEVSCGGAKTRFEVAGYSLAAMSGRVADAVVEDGELRAKLDLSSLARPVSGRVRVVVLENGRPVHGPVELASLDGVVSASFLLVGEGPFVAHVTGIDDPGLDTQIPLRGTAKRDRDEACLSRLGVEWVASALKSEGARACRGLWIREDGRNNAPVRVDEVIADAGRIHAQAAIEHAVLTVLHPGEGRVQHRLVGTLAAGESVEFGVQAPFSVALIGGFVNGAPWEGMACLVPPADLGLALDAPERAEPRTELALKLRTARPRGEASVFVVVRDARLTPMDHPLVALGTGIKASMAVIGAARPHVTSVPRVVTSRLKDRKKGKLGEMLVANGFVTQEQVREALNQQRRSGKRIGQLLTEMRAVTERDVTECVAAQLDALVIDLSNCVIDPAIAKLVPEHIAQRHQLIPINKVGNKLTIAMVDPLNVLALDDIQLMTGLQVKSVVATPTDVQRALQDCFGACSQLDKVFGDICGDVAPARDDDDLDSCGELSEFDAPIIKLVNLILTQAFVSECSGVRIEPGAHGVEVYFRGRDGERLEMTPPARALPAMLDRMRVLCALELGRPGEGVVRLKINGKSVQARIAFTKGDRAEITFEEEGAGGPARERFPEVVFAGLVHVRGEYTVYVPLGDALGRLEVDAFAVHRGDWEGVSRTVEVARETFGELTLPELVHPGDTAAGRLDVGWGRGPVTVELTREGAPVALTTRDGQPFVPAAGPGRATLAFPAAPGRWQCVVRDGAREDRSVREVAQPGVFRGLARRVRVLQAGEALSAEECGAISLRVLPGADLPLREVAQVTASYEHLCCEQTAAKILGALDAWRSSTDAGEKARLESVVHAGVERERKMWVRGQGLRLYPNTGVNDYWGSVAVERLLVIAATYASARLPRELDAAVRALSEITDDLVAPCRIEVAPKSPTTTLQAYRGAMHRSASDTAIQSAVASTSGRTATDVMSRADLCHAAAALLRSGSSDTMRRALAIVDAIGAQRGVNGAFYSTIDSAAAIMMFHELARLSMMGLGASARARVDGTVARVQDVAARGGEVSRIEALDAPVVVEATELVCDDWTAFRSNAPFSARWNRERTGALQAGETLNLELAVERYQDGDLAHVCLPPALAKLSGGGRVQTFAADFAGKDKLSVPVVVLDPAPGTQHWFACLRNMFDEKRVGNPGVMPLALR